MQFSDACQVKTDSLATYERYRAVSEPYTVVGIFSSLGLPERWLALQDNGREVLVSRHRVRNAAEQACRKHSRRAKC